METSRGLIKELDAIVLSAKMQKTVVVETRSHVKHPVYGRYYVRRSKFSAHDENGVAAQGDWVRVRETRPLSKNKRWKVVGILKKAPVDALLLDVVTAGAKTKGAKSAQGKATVAASGSKSKAKAAVGPARKKKGVVS